MGIRKVSGKVMCSEFSWWCQVYSVQLVKGQVGQVNYMLYLLRKVRVVSVGWLSWQMFQLIYSLNWLVVLVGIRWCSVIIQVVLINSVSGSVSNSSRLRVWLFLCSVVSRISVIIMLIGSSQLQVSISMFSVRFSQMLWCSLLVLNRCVVLNMVQVIRVICRVLGLVLWLCSSRLRKLRQIRKVLLVSVWLKFLGLGWLLKVSFNGCVLVWWFSRQVVYQIDSELIRKQLMMEMWVVSGLFSSQLNSLMQIVLNQQVSGFFVGSGRLVMLGVSQLVRLLWVMVYMMLKLVVFLFFQGLWLIRLGRMQRRVSVSMVRCGSVLVVVVGRWIGFIKILLFLFCVVCWVMCGLGWFGLCGCCCWWLVFLVGVFLVGFIVQENLVNSCFCLLYDGVVFDVVLLVSLIKKVVGAVFFGGSIDYVFEIVVFELMELNFWWNFLMWLVVLMILCLLVQNGCDLEEILIFIRGYCLFLNLLVLWVLMVEWVMNLKLFDMLWNRILW